MDTNNLETGDIVLLHGSYLISKIIEYFAGTKYSHIGVIIKDPWFTAQKLKGIYLLESGEENTPDPENHRYKYGVQLTLLDNIIKNYNGSIYIRKLNCVRDNEFKNKITQIHSDVHNLSYDTNICDWLKAYFNIEIGNEHKTNTYWCSALVAYVYVKLGFLDSNTKWTIISPSFFSAENKNLKLINCTLDKEILLKNN